MSLSGLFSTLWAFILALGILITVHEFGHFIVARWCGVRVLRFSVGFGKSIWRKRLGKDRTELSIGLFPLGGYVKMLDEREMAVKPSEVHRAFNRQSLAARSAIVVAGPAANFLLAIFVYWFVFLTGSQELLPVLGTPTASSPAEIAGITAGEQVRAVDQVPVRTWEDFRWVLLQKAVAEDSVTLELVNSRDEITFRSLRLGAVRENGWQGDGFARLGIVFFRPVIPAILVSVAADGIADRAGLRVGDRVQSIDGKNLGSWRDLVEIVRDAPGKSLRFGIERGPESLDFDLVPAPTDEQGTLVGRIGVGVAEPKDVRVVRGLIRYGFFESGTRAVRETWEKSVFSLVMLGKMLVGEVSLKTLAGPITIADYAGQSARLGLDYYLKFIALVSVSLGVLNLLPVPVLDGGHLLYHMLEFFKRSPLSERFIEVTQNVGMFLLLVLMSFAFYNDIHRLLTG